MFHCPVGSHLVRCCRIITRDKMLWRGISVQPLVSEKVTRNSPKFVNSAGFTTDITQPLNLAEKIASNSNKTVPEEQIDPVAHLKLKKGLENDVRLCNSVLSVLNLIADIKMMPIHVHIVLERLCQLHAADKEKTQQELALAFKTPLYQKLEDVVDRDISRIPSPMLLNCLSFTLALIPEDNHLVKSLETQTMWLMRRFTIGQIVRVLEIHSNHQETEMRQGMFRNALTSVEKRWAEISNPKDVVTLLYLTFENSDRLGEKLEDKALELAEEMSPKDLYRVAYLLAKKRHRNTPLLRAVTYHLNKAKLKLSSVHLANLLFACSSLNVRDTNLLEKITSDLRQKGNERQLNSPYLLASVLHSLANLRWQNQLTLDVLFDLVKSNLESFNSKDMVTVVLSTAKLNYVSSFTSTLLPLLVDRLSKDKEIDQKMWLDVVWSMAVLKLMTPEMAASVLGPEVFLSLAGDDAFKTITRHIKQLNIQAAAEYELTNYTGPKLPSFTDDSMAKTLLRGERPLAHAVLTVLNTMAPSDQYMKTRTVSKSGYYIDADLFVNLSGQPLVYTEYIDKDTVAVKRLAIRVLDFGDLTLDTKLPTGLHAMASRHIAAEGYYVVEIPYTEFDEKATTVQKVQYLQQKINVAIGKQKNTNNSSDPS